MKIVLSAMETAISDAWRSECQGIDGVEIHDGSIFDTDCDALISPANSFGFMDGGIDYQYSETFGWDIQLKLRRLILDRHHGELLVGQAEIIETGSDKHPFIIAAPTMRVPMYLDETTIAPYLATRAALLLVKHGVFPAGPFAGKPVKSKITSMAFPAMGMGVGRVPANICARQMRTALQEFLLDEFRLPTSWAEASERHQLLYTDSPVRLQ